MSHSLPPAVFLIGSRQHSVESGAKGSCFLAPGVSSPAGRFSGVAGRRAAAFTLLEMLVVIGLIAILTALIAPSLQGLLGVAGRRGGANALAAAIEQARLAAVENGTAAYVGFGAAATNKDNAFSSLIVFRSKRDDETAAPAYVPLSRWLRLPTGVYMDPASMSASATTTVTASAMLPKLGPETLTSFPAIEFDRFGRLKDQTKTPVLRVGEGILNDSSVTFRPNSNAHYALTILPLTGRVQIADASTNSP